MVITLVRDSSWYSGMVVVVGRSSRSRDIVAFRPAASVAAVVTEGTAGQRTCWRADEDAADATDATDVTYATDATYATNVADVAHSDMKVLVVVADT